MVMTRSKRAKRVLRCLSFSQHQDELLSPSTTPLIRYTLLHNYRCRQVSIDLMEPVDPIPNTVSYNDLPKFLRSQLEAQKITDGSRLWSQIVPILTFIQANLRRFGCSRGFPTLFLWYSAENHRSYFFFAFVENKMPSKTYTPRELSHMRQTPVSKEMYDELQERLQQDLELGEIVRMPLERSLPLIKEEPHDMSGDSDDHDPPKKRMPRQLDGTEYEWKYRGRTGSEVVEVQPISAPSDPLAQKDEGFQRFYKAVVSPTHVRVTAGGRIVPNTRASSSPTAKLIKDKIAGDASSNNRSPSHAAPEQVPIAMPPHMSHMPHLPPPFGVYHAPMFHGFAPGVVPGAVPGAVPGTVPGVVPGVIPGVVPGVIPGAVPGMPPVMPPGMPPGPIPFPMMPWPMGLPFPGMPPHLLGPVPGHKPTVQSSSKGEIQNDSGDAKANQVPAAEQQDPVRPVPFNGQWMMPPGPPIFPPYAMSPHGFPVPPMLGHAMPVQRFGVAPVMLHHPQKQGSAQAPNAPAQVRPSVPTPTATDRLPISSIRQSEITRRQLLSLRASLKYYEDQLQYNKHQINEQEVEGAAQRFRELIRDFEKSFELQTAMEEFYYPKRMTKEGTTDSTSSQNATGSKSSVDDNNTKPEHGSDSVPSSQGEAPAREAKSSREQGTAQGTNGSGSTKMTAFSTDDPASKKSSTLPVTAALAPPFHPRAACQNLSRVSNEALAASGGQWSSNSTEVRDGKGIAGEPYLVGRLPPGISPEAAADDYVYPRELTPDELRARYLYWGNAPHKLQSGLPKFDGKDFYPPSPVSGRSAETIASGSIRGNKGRAVSAEAVEVNDSGKIPTTTLDPFQSSNQRGGVHLSQSESLAKPERVVANNAATLPRSFRQPSPSKSPKVESSSDSDGDDKQKILFKGRNSWRMKRKVVRPTPAFEGTPLNPSKVRTRDEIWQNMRRGPPSGNAAPGMVSSMTAQGVLPHYTGHATAALTPAITNTTSSPRTVNGREAGSTTPAADTQVENRPPSEQKAVRFSSFVFRKKTPPLTE